MTRPILIAVVLALASTAAAQTPKYESLDDLLKAVKGGMRTNNEELKKREEAFATVKNTQDALLREAKAQLDAADIHSKDLERRFETNEKRITELEETLRNRLGTMGELFGVVRQVAGDTRGHIEASVVSAQYPDRAAPLTALVQSKSLPSIPQLEDLWYALQREATESGKVARFAAKVVLPDGSEQEREVVRVGPFNAVAAGKYLVWSPEVKKLRELKRQPPSHFLSTAKDLEDAESGMVRFALDPSRGQILDMMVQTPTLQERIESGGAVGYIIIAIGIIGLLIGLIRLVQLSWVRSRVRSQQSHATPNGNNPLGRIMQVHNANLGLSTETLELKLDEAIAHEQSRLERLLWAIKVVSVVAPLLGLLGTVTGMIKTFQIIVLFGTGDPKMMAGGISEALVTTMLGLIVAIPLVVLHSWVKSLSSHVMDVLAEQSTGIIAEHANKDRA